MKQSLGLIEVRGLALAVNVADAMAKSAAIRLVGVENTNGGGWMTIKVTGDVAAVKSALSTGAALAQAHDGLISHTVLSRAVESVMAMTVPASHPVMQAATQGAEVSDSEPLSPALELSESPLGLVVTPAEPDADESLESDKSLPAAKNIADMAEQADAPEPVELLLLTEQQEEPAPVDERVAPPVEAMPEPTSSHKASCNLCNDPQCPREKGEPHHKCLHARG